MEHIVEILAQKFGLDLNKVVKRSYGSRKGFTGKELLISLLVSSSTEEASTLLGYNTRDPLKDSIKNYLSSIPKHGGINCKWQNVLLYNAGYHKCCGCKKILSIEDFAKLNTRNIGIQAHCRKCSFILAKERKEHIKDRTPIWADLDAIREIYHKCPEGHHVDHILPLRGAEVSGLHIETNLQYLTVEDNQKKGNKYTPE